MLTALIKRMDGFDNLRCLTEHEKSAKVAAKKSANKPSYICVIKPINFECQLANVEENNCVYERKVKTASFGIKC